MSASSNSSPSRPSEVSEISEGVSLRRSSGSNSRSFPTPSTLSDDVAVARGVVGDVDESVVRGEKSKSELLEGGVQAGPSRTY